MSVYLDLSNLFNILDYSLNVAILSVGDCKILEADNMHSGSVVILLCLFSVATVIDYHKLEDNHTSQFCEV